MNKHRQLNLQQKSPHYEQFDGKSRPRPLPKFAVENTTPVDPNGISRKRTSAETANAAILVRKRRTINKITENLEQDSINHRKNESTTVDSIGQIDDELLKRLSQGKDNEHSRGEEEREKSFRFCLYRSTDGYSMDWNKDTT